MASSSPKKPKMTVTEGKGSKVKNTASSGSSASPLMSLSKKSYSKNKNKPSDVAAFGTPGFGLTGMTGED
jgi:hypothetical protein